MLIGEICRAATNIDNARSSDAVRSSAQDCRLIYGNLPELLLQPLQVELLSFDPYIAIYHKVLSIEEMSDMQQIIADVDDGDERTLAEFLNRTSIAKHFQLIAGHAGNNLDAWEVERWTFEDDVHTDALMPATAEIIANVLLNVSETWMADSQMWLNQLYSTILICSCKQPSWGAPLSFRSWNWA